jgi:hypothetical protein
MEGLITIHCQTLAPILSQMNSFNIHFLNIQNTQHQPTFTSFWGQLQLALPTTLYTEDAQNGTHIPGSWSTIISGVAEATNMRWHLKKGSADAKSWKMKEPFLGKVCVSNQTSLAPSAQKFASVMVQFIQLVKIMGGGRPNCTEFNLN